MIKYVPQMNDETIEGAGGISLTVDGYRAIAHASIAVDSITVLSGVNASGKSSIAHLMHTLVNFSANFELYARRWALSRIRRIMRPVDDFYSVGEDKLMRPRLGKMLESGSSVSEMVDSCRKYIQMVFDNVDVGDVGPTLKRAYAMLRRDLNLREDFGDVERVKKILNDNLSKVETDYNRSVKNRRLDPLLSVAPDASSWLLQNGKVVLQEEGVDIYRAEMGQDDELQVSTPPQDLIGIDRSIYIASPWTSVPQIRDSRVTLGDEFFCRCNEDFSPDNTLFEVLDGDIELKADEGIGRWALRQDPFWEYKRLDGRRFLWRDLATGLKSLSILNILYKNGCLDSRTLLIIDEPEAHLHPQWIVEYARILVLIAKRLKVRMLLASHSPDMISAIAEAEALEGVRFYLAEHRKDMQEYTYEYKELGKDVEPIFKAFNKAIDAVEMYTPSFQ